MNEQRVQVTQSTGAGLIARQQRLGYVTGIREAMLATSRLREELGPDDQAGFDALSRLFDRLDALRRTVRAEIEQEHSP